MPLPRSIASGCRKRSQLSDLDTPTLSCAIGSWGDNTINTVYNSGNRYGHRFFESASGEYLIYTAPTSYTGGNCGGVRAGRSWLSPPNYGCNVTKMFVR